MANNKDMQLQADMTQLNKNRKKIKEQLEEERKKLENLSQIPEKHRQVNTSIFLSVFLLTVTFQSIEEYAAHEEKLTNKKEELEAQKTRLLETLREETRDLQERKSEFQDQLVEVNKAVIPAKSAVSFSRFVDVIMVFN